VLPSFGSKTTVVNEPPDPAPNDSHAMGTAVPDCAEARHQNADATRSTTLSGADAFFAKVVAFLEQKALGKGTDEHGLTRTDTD